MFKYSSGAGRSQEDVRENMVQSFANFKDIMEHVRQMKSEKHLIKENN